jgi:hypothetical protein
VVALIGGMASAQRRDFDKITGGGQIDVAADGQGAGNTIAFFAGETPVGDTGQVQYVDTSSAGSGGPPESWHGRVDCVEVDDETTGRMSGTASDGETFWIQVMDVSNGNSDVIELSKPSDETCEEQDDDATTHELGRGNLTVHDAP